MLPGKKYTPEDLLLILRRRFWLVLLPLAVGAAGAAVYGSRLPDLFQSQAVILVAPPRVPVDVIRTQAQARLEDRLPGIQQQILSRSRLERIITDLNLYQEQRRTGIMEDIVEEMKAAITVRVLRGDAFTVSFTGRDPRNVMRVAERLSSAFIEESLRDRENLVAGTGEFLESSLEEARRRLIETEQKREAYRRRFAGELPTEIGTNLSAMNNLQMQIQAIHETVDRAQERRLLLERQLAELESLADSGEAASEPVPSGAGTTAQQLALARAGLAQLQLTKRIEHPDVQTLRRVVRDLEAKLEAEALAAPVSSDGGRSLSPVEQQRQRRIADIRNQLDELSKHTARNLSDVDKYRKTAAEYQRRAESGPTRETEMVELNRDYNTLQGMYTNLLGKKEEANIAANLERRQIGEQFKLVDPARLPSRPFSPDRRRLNMIGMVAGLGIGLAFIALLEYRSVSLQTDDELTSVVGLPVLAVVPLMESDQERKRRIRIRVFVGVILGGTVMGCLAIVAYTLLR